MLKVATPFTAETVLVPPNVPLPLARAMVTLDEFVVTTLLYWSSTLTRIVEIVCPAVIFPGCCVITSLLAAAGEMLKLPDVSAVSPPSLTPSVNVPTLWIDKSLKVATPLTAATVCVPTCGDGVAVADEECDNGKDNSDTSYGGCTTACTWGSFCGDGIVNGPEECDAGKNNGLQYGQGGCTFGCTKAHFCGDGHVDTNRGEECDLSGQNGKTLDRIGSPSTDADALIYCTTDCKIPPGVVY